MVNFNYTFITLIEILSNKKIIYLETGGFCPIIKAGLIFVITNLLPTKSEITAVIIKFFIVALNNPEITGIFAYCENFSIIEEISSCVKLIFVGEGLLNILIVISLSGPEHSMLVILGSSII